MVICINKNIAKMLFCALYTIVRVSDRTFSWGENPIAPPPYETVISMASFSLVPKIPSSHEETRSMSTFFVVPSKLMITSLWLALFLWLDLADCCMRLVLVTLVSNNDINSAYLFCPPCDHAYVIIQLIRSVHTRYL